MTKITQSNAEAIAHKLRKGIDNGGIERDALAAFLEWVAESLETDRSIINRLEESVNSIRLENERIKSELREAKGYLLFE